ncbi:MAG TPA: isoprenylcysteine carboxylmethyltransferase family protein [Blastocatellia bacterium]|jgi:protein-S-isoprenylcysteine O-methyltransferase Ste14
MNNTANKKEVDVLSSEAPKIGFKNFAQRIRVSAGFILVPLLVVAARPTVKTLIAGGATALFGLGIRAWASGHLKKNQELTTSGPYAHTRNPLYLGTFIMGAGAAVASSSLRFVAAYLGFYLLIYVPVMIAEAETMRKLFSDEYEKYSQRVPMFVPRLTPYRSADETRDDERSFDLSQYLRHREYRAAIGCAIVFLILIAKLIIAGN